MCKVGDIIVVKNYKSHGKEGYIKAEQFYYFDRSKTDFYVLGNVDPELFNELMEYIQTLNEIEIIVDNL